MLKSVALSLTLGVLLMLAIVALPQLYNSVGAEIQVLTWGADEVEVRRGSVEALGDAMGLELDRSGRAFVSLPLQSVRAQDYAYFEVVLEAEPDRGALSLLWQTREGGDAVVAHHLPDGFRESVSVSTLELEDWSGEITALALVLFGSPGEQIKVEKLALSPATLFARARSVASAWTAFLPWRQDSINTYYGVEINREAPYPVPVVAVMMLLSVVSYLLLSRTGWLGGGFQWRVVGGIVLVGWLAVDILWQHQLWRQLDTTQQTFSGKSTQEQLLAGPDAQLVEFMVRIRDSIKTAEPRIFVSSGSDYLGMRGAYYLYPYNVYWSRHGEELHYARALRAGDFVAIINPTETQFDPERGLLSDKRSRSFGGELLLKHEMGSLFRVK